MIRWLALAPLLPFSALAGPVQLVHQTRILDAAGAGQSGEHTLTISLHDASTAGTTLFTETFSNIHTDDGYAAVSLGEDDGNPLESSVFSNPQVWAETTVDGVSLSPRKLLHSVPYAAHAEHAETAERAEHAEHAETAHVADLADLADLARHASSAISADTAQYANHAFNADHINGLTADQLIPSGAILMFSGDCPQGFTNFDALNDRLPRGAGSGAPGTSGGSDTHGHGDTGTTDVPHSHDFQARGLSAAQIGGGLYASGNYGGLEAKFLFGDDGTSLACGGAGHQCIGGATLDYFPTRGTRESTNHAHTVNPASSLPAYHTVRFCEKD